MHVTFVRKCIIVFVSSTTPYHGCIPQSDPLPSGVLAASWPASMSLLDCICCWRHCSRTALVWDDLVSGAPCFYTYSDLLTRATEVAETLCEMLPPDAVSIGPIALYGRGCPEILVAILAVLSLRVSEDGGVAFMPLSPAPFPGEAWREQEGLLVKCGVELVIVEISLLQVFRCDRVTLMYVWR